MIHAIVLIALLYPSAERVTEKMEKVNQPWAGRMTIGEAFEYPKQAPVVPVKRQLREVKP